jgi:hypothetical protein
LMMKSFDWASSLLSPGVSGLIDMRVERCLQLGSRCRDWPHACDLGPLDVERRRHRERFGERQIDRTALLPGLVDPTNRILVLRDWMAMVRPTLRTSGATLPIPRSPRASVSHWAVASIVSTVTPSCGASGSRIKTTAQPARALNRSAVGLGASLVPPSGTGMSVCQENEPCSITA